jgi:type I restriction enzyme R subunit
MELPDVYKVVFVVDRKRFGLPNHDRVQCVQKDSVDVTDNTQSIRQLTDNTKLELTTIQKLDNAVLPL